MTYLEIFAWGFAILGLAAAVALGVYVARHWRDAEADWREVPDRERL